MEVCIEEAGQSEKCVLCLGHQVVGEEETDIQGTAELITWNRQKRSVNSQRPDMRAGGGAMGGGSGDHERR